MVFMLSEAISPGAHHQSQTSSTTTKVAHTSSGHYPWATTRLNTHPSHGASSTNCSNGAPPDPSSTRPPGLGHPRAGAAAAHHPADGAGRKTFGGGVGGGEAVALDERRVETRRLRCRAENQGNSSRRCRTPPAARQDPNASAHDIPCPPPHRFISMAAGMVPSASPRWLRLTGTVANCLLSRQHLTDQPAERHDDCRVRAAERLRERPEPWHCAWRGGRPVDGAKAFRNACMNRHRSAFRTRPSLKTGNASPGRPVRSTDRGMPHPIGLFAKAVEACRPRCREFRNRRRRSPACRAATDRR